MRFWDSSALVPLVLRQPASDAVRGLFKTDPQILAWTLSDVEIRSSICRLLRDRAIEPAVADEAAADALQLGAALVATYDQPLGSAFVTLDAKLADAARREGFRVLP